MEISDKNFTNTFNVNIIGIWRVCKLLYTNKLLNYSNKNKNDNSRIIIISSEMASCHIVPFGEPYGITKSCLQNICRTLKIELSTIGIDVITINPGAVNTQLLKHTQQRFAKYRDKDSPFKQSCDLSLKLKDKILKYSSCSEYYK